jgi:accessory colonization factor AcfC
MAYAASGLCRINGDSNGNLWTYNTADAIAAVNTAGYFNDAVNMLKVRDVIIVKDTNIPTTHFVTVLSNNGTAVDVSDGTAIAETDGD